MQTINVYMPTIEAKVIADSVNTSGNRVTTLVLKYPRFMHPELMTHRDFSRNAASSRAIPTKKVLSNIWNDPMVPNWTENCAGMQSNAQITGIRRVLADVIWKFAGKVACMAAWALNKLNVHKQHANRCIEPWWDGYTVILTATEFTNFFRQRLSESAQPEMHWLAKRMNYAISESVPKLLQPGEWHLPFVSDLERTEFSIETCQKLSAARCARVSYMNHDGTNPNPIKDIETYNNLRKNGHMSPFEHQARALSLPTRIGNLVGWEQLRKTIIGEYHMSEPYNVLTVNNG